MEYVKRRNDARGLDDWEQRLDGSREIVADRSIRVVSVIRHDNTSASESARKKLRSDSNKQFTIYVSQLTMEIAERLLVDC